MDTYSYFLNPAGGFYWQQSRMVFFQKRRKRQKPFFVSGSSIGWKPAWNGSDCAKWRQSGLCGMNRTEKRGGSDL